MRGVAHVPGRVLVRRVVKAESVVSRPKSYKVSLNYAETHEAVGEIPPERVSVAVVNSPTSSSVFSECTMRPLTVRGGQWQSVTIRGTNLSKVDLSGVDLREADLSMSDLSFAVMRNTQLDRATLRETKLDDADLRGASLDGVDLASALLRRTKLDLAGAVLLAELRGADVDPAC